MLKDPKFGHFLSPISLQAPLPYSKTFWHGHIPPEHGIESPLFLALPVGVGAIMLSRKPFYHQHYLIIIRILLADLTETSHAYPKFITMLSTGLGHTHNWFCMWHKKILMAPQEQTMGCAALALEIKTDAICRNNLFSYSYFI
jgi:hypothetical protein